MSTSVSTPSTSNVMKPVGAAPALAGVTRAVSVTAWLAPAGLGDAVNTSDVLMRFGPTTTLTLVRWAWSTTLTGSGNVTDAGAPSPSGSTLSWYSPSGTP